MTVYVDMYEYVFTYVCKDVHTHVFIKFHYDRILPCVLVTKIAMTIISLTAV